MTADKPLSILISITSSEPKALSLSTQKLCIRGNPTGPISTFEMPQENSAPEGAQELAKRILKETKKRRILHHNQPEIEQILKGLISDSGLNPLRNQFCCTQHSILATGSCSYDPDLFELARREGVPEQTITMAKINSAERCALYTTVFTSYIRGLRADIFETPTLASDSWVQTLTIDERQIVERDIPVDQLPTGWSLPEAQSLWLMYQSGDALPALAQMVGQPESVLSDICCLFEQTA